MNQGNDNLFGGLGDIIEGDAGFDGILEQGGSGAQRAVLGRYNYQFTELPVPLPEIPINQHPGNIFGINAGINPQEHYRPQLPPNPNPPALHNPSPQTPPPPPPGPGPNPLPQPTPEPPATIMRLPKVNGRVALEGGVRVLGTAEIMAFFDAELKAVRQCVAEGRSVRETVNRIAALGLPNLKSHVSYKSLHERGGKSRMMSVEERNDIWKLKGENWANTSIAQKLGRNRKAIGKYLDEEKPAERRFPPWTDVENNVLRNRIRQHCGNTAESWEEVKFALYGRSVLACKSHYEEMCRELWDAQRRSGDLRSMEQMRNNERNWAEIAQHFPERTAVMCELYYDRYINRSLI